MTNEKMTPPFHATAFNGKLTGFVMILMGGIFFMGMSGITILGYSPWILMAFLPAFWAGATAVNVYRHGGAISGHFIVVMLFTLLPFAYMFAARLGLNVGMLWPLALIIMGLVFLFSRR